MNDLISRSALLEEFRARKMTDAVPNYDRATVDVKDALYQYAQLTKGLLFAAPYVDAEVVRHGFWIPQDNTRTKFMCSDCKSRNHDGSGKYCSLCGCKMDAEVQDEIATDKK